MILQHILKNLRLFCEWTQVPCISRNTETFLSKLIHTYKPKSILEIGSAYWYSLLAMWLAINEWWWKIIWCERAYPNRVEINKLLSLTKQYSLHNLDCFYGPFLKFDPQTRKQNWELGVGSWDLVFIDAQKAEYPAYIDYLIENKLINNQTIILFDDVIKYQERMPWLYEKLEQYGYIIHIEQLDEDDGILIAKHNKFSGDNLKA
jgi:predicted O-methyltransferase YrrM